MTHRLGVESEVGQLWQAIVYRAGLELTRLTPSNCDELLFDDVLWADRARRPRELWPPGRPRRDRAGAGRRQPRPGPGHRRLDPRRGGSGLRLHRRVGEHGESDADWATRVPLLPFRVTAELMVSTGRSDTMFMCCLPWLHNTDTDLGRRLHEQFGLDGAEVSNDVFESPPTIAFDQAENRLHTIKAVMVDALGTGR